MTHEEQAELLLDQAGESRSEDRKILLMSEAQVHATLAVAEALTKAQPEPMQVTMHVDGKTIRKSISA